MGDGDDDQAGYDLDAAYAAAVIDRSVYPYESEEEQRVAQSRRNIRHRRRSFGQLPSLAVHTTFDEALPDTEVTLWEDDS